MLCSNEDGDKECKFDLLDDSCCYEILHCLPLVDLCALSRTCVRFYNLCNKEFQLEYPSRVMYIDGVDDNGELIKGLSQEKYVAAFDKSICNVVLRGRPLASKLDALNAYYNQDESVKDRPIPIKQISLFQWFKRDFNDVSRTLPDLLQNIETFIFDIVAIEVDWYDMFLRYTPNIKHIKVLYRNYFNGHQNWLENAYPHLETLECYSLEIPLPEKLNTFRRLNPNVRHVSLYAEHPQTIIEWMENDVKVDELFFFANDGCFDFDDLSDLGLDTVAELIKAQNTKVHLSIYEFTAKLISEDALIRKIISMQSNIEGLYFPRFKVGKKLATAISTFENVRVLLVDTCKDNKIIAQMPKLEEMYFGRLRWQDCELVFDAMYDLIRILAGAAAKLKKIYVTNDHIPFTRFKFADLDRERMKLNGACKLKIYINSKENDATGKLDDADRIFNRIEIIRALSEPTHNPHVDRITQPHIALWEKSFE